MTRAQRLAKAAAWERMARIAEREDNAFVAGREARVPFRDVSPLYREGHQGYQSESRALLSLHCLSEAARLRSGVPV